MSKKKAKPLHRVIDECLKYGDKKIPAIAGILVANSMAGNVSMLQEILDEKNKEIDELKAKVTEYEEYIYRIKKRLNYFLFEAPKFETSAGYPLEEKACLFKTRWEDT